MAREANVSTATVSHVINKSRYVSDEVRDRVVAAIRKLGYIANANARGLRSSVSHRIGLIVPEISDYFPVNILEPIETILKEKGYHLIIGYTHDDMEQERSQIEQMSYQQIDGLLMYPAIGDHSYLNDLDLGYPIVMLDRIAENYQCDYVMADDEPAAYEATAKLAVAGYRRIAVILREEGMSTTHTRLAGYERAVREFGLERDPRLIKRGSNLFQSGIGLTEEVLEEGIADAILVTNLLMTLGAVKCLKDRGIAMPGQMGVMGWGDSRWTELLTPPLSVLQHPNLTMGTMAAKVLLEKIANPQKTPRHYLMPVEMKIRGSF